MARYLRPRLERGRLRLEVLPSLHNLEHILIMDAFQDWHGAAQKLRDKMLAGEKITITGKGLMTFSFSETADRGSIRFGSDFGQLGRFEQIKLLDALYAEIQALRDRYSHGLPVYVCAA